MITTLQCIDCIISISTQKYFTSIVKAEATWFNSFRTTLSNCYQIKKADFKFSVVIIFNKADYVPVISVIKRAVV